MKKIVTLLEDNSKEELNNSIDREIEFLEKDGLYLETVDIKPYTYVDIRNNEMGETFYLATLVFSKE